MSLNKKFDTVVYQGAGGEEAGAPVVVSVALDAAGNPVTPLAAGPAPAGQSVPTTEAAYSSTAQYTGSPTTVGRAVAFVCTAAGTATLTFPSGSMVIPVNPGLTVLPFACTNAVQTTGSMTIFKLI